MKHVNFVPKDVQRILSSHKISERYNEQKVFYKKAVLKNFAIFTGKHPRWNLFFNKNAGFLACSFIKKRLEHRWFFSNTEKFLKIPILKNICEQLLLTVSLELFPTWTNNIGSEEDVFPRNKNRSKTQLYEQKLPFHDVLYHFVFLYSFTSCQAAFALHNKKWPSESFETA